MTQYLFISKNNNFYARVCLLASLLALLVIALGAYTRLTNAGLSCPDWPVCYGYLTAPHTQEQVQAAAQKYPGTPVETTKAWTEMVHRYLAGGISLFVIFLVYSTGRLQKNTGLSFTSARIALVMLLACQVLLGALTVTMKLTPFIVLGHLVTGLALLSLLWWLFLTFSNLPKPVFIDAKIKPWAWLGLLLLIAQITLGGWVSTHYAGLACIDFPYCNGVALPPLNLQKLNTDLITIHMLHRLGAIITAAFLGFLALYLLRNKALRFIASLILVLLVGQITLGILNIIWLRPVHIALTHNVIAALLLLCMVTMLVKIYRKPQR